ncbi:hypothetical protein GIB67_032217 [Kingdonia uniflora]|uniref:SWIM-type domain-containing protein n=1 Tax=Kingdonia uniflora TaxID=39325 RepID=A0A7J7MX38_9MAGN|nr:hypothetical protein GIB67_032217 [Kingdonia uniflora]
MEKYHKGTHMEMLVWGAAKSFRLIEKQCFLDKIQEDNLAAKVWLDREPYKSWCRSQFDFTSKYEHITNNFSKFLNWRIMKIRDKPLDKAIKRLNFMLMMLHNKRRIKARTWDQSGLVPRALEYIERLKKHYGDYDFEGEGDDGFVSIDGNRNRWKLNLVTQVCECNEWQLIGVSCIHAASVIIPMSLCSEYHHVSSYVATYAGVVHMVTDSSNWEKPNRQGEPPPFVRGPGRPRGTRPRLQAKCVPRNPHRTHEFQVTESQGRGRGTKRRGRGRCNGRQGEGRGSQTTTRGR